MRVRMRAVRADITPLKIRLDDALSRATPWDADWANSKKHSGVFYDFGLGV